jgi:hypothetical protein
MFRTIIRFAVSAVAYAAARAPQATACTLMVDSILAACELPANEVRGDRFDPNRKPAEFRRPAHSGKTDYG